MILIADSGSTKCDWLLTDPNGNIILKQKTPGINPVMFTLDEIKERVGLATDILSNADQITHVYFYGAGCGLDGNQELMQKALFAFYVDAKVEVQSDLVAAVRATTKEPGIVCILGTGSNSCYYDGDTIHFGFDSLGYSVMDEASGNYFGRELLKDFFYKKMPSNIAERFASEYDVSANQVLLHLYKEPMPAKYLASFAKFIFEVGLSDNYIQRLLEKGFNELIEYQFKLWPNYQKLPIHFIGSIAYYAKDILKSTLESENMTVGRILRTPLQGLYNYHTMEPKAK